MKPIFSKLGEKLLEAVSLTDTLYAFDFDGTLAPIVRMPDDAKMSSPMLKSLENLSKIANIAVISGRSVKDLKSRVPIAGIALIGNHGLEGLDSKPDALARAQEISSQWEKQIKQVLKGSSQFTGVMLENKAYSLAIHYRLSRNKKAAKVLLMEMFARIEPSPRLILGKCVINLIPPGGPHKGVALLELMMRFGKRSALYIGDDDTDEDVFSLPDSGLLTIRVARKLNSAAQFYVDQQSDVRRIIDCSTRNLRKK